MRRGRACFLALCLGLGAPALAVADGTACLGAIAAIEPGSGLPPGLLGAIAHVESGRADPAGGPVRPWPHAYNAGGNGHYPATRAQAVAEVAALLARGQRQVDVGCMQVSLPHHPGAFASLEEAFDPLRNVAYAAAFLLALHARHGDWPTAIAHYHSGTAERGAAYLARVRAAWTGAEAEAEAAASRPDPHTILRGPAAGLVRVITQGRQPIGR